MRILVRATALLAVVLGILSVIARQAVASRIEAGAGGSGRLAMVTDYAGALAIMAIGAGLFWATV